MCGIAGIFRFGGEPDRTHLGGMLDVLEHRGPDDDHDLSLRDGCMGTRRLAIVDLEGGRQPLMDSSTRIALAFNGEIYNHTSLRRELEARGEPFQTVSEVEVAATLFAQLPPSKALGRMIGQLALAAYDTQARRLWLARDRLGQKPLYWSELPDGTLVFGSEIKSLLRHPGVSRTVDPVGLEQLLLFEFVPAPRTIYRNIHKLEPGTLLEADEQGIRITRWWTPPLVGADRSQIAWERSEDAIRQSLRTATQRRMNADVPVAYLLSGGIDSSAIVALAADRSTDPLPTFAVTFQESSFDESGPAARVAAHLGTDHHTLPFAASDLDGMLAEMERGLCEPMADGSFPSTLWLGRGVRDAGYKVAISGDGADEHFGGYPTYQAHSLASALAPAQRLVSKFAHRLPASTENLSTGFKARRFAAGLGQPFARRNQIWLGAFRPEELKPLLGREPTPWSEVDRHDETARKIRLPSERAMYLDQRLYLPEGVLAKADRAMMLASVELRSPFLDHALVELAATLPKGAYVNPRRTKVLLRRAVAPWLPQEITQRPKKGFGTPLAAWLAGPCGHLLDDLPDRLEGVVATAEVTRLVAEHRRGWRDHRRRLWSLIVLGRWWHGPWGPA